MSLREYRKKRDVAKTAEPNPTRGKERKDGRRIFVVHKHYASHLHYDFRLEMGGVLKSWAVPKGPPKKIGEKHLAVHVEDHPLKYAKFYGTIPEGHYGAGKVEIWDKGAYVLLDGSVHKGKIVVELRGKKLKGGFALAQMRGGKNWLLIKVKRD